MDYLVRFVLGLYPSWWRKRYGKETQEVTEELLADPDTNKVRILGSLLFGATTAWFQIRRRATYLQPVSAGGPPMLPADSSSPTGHRRALVLGIVVVLMCVALLCAGYVVALRRTFGPLSARALPTPLKVLPPDHRRLMRLQRSIESRIRR
jgi:hypothetical protein